MAITIGGDYYQLSGQAAPRGLVSDPPNYASCVAAVRAIRRRSVNNEPKPASGELESKCRQLYQVLKQQALSYLISAEWSIGESAEYGVHVTDQEVKQQFTRIRSEQFPKQSELQKYLARKGWTLSDELFLVKQNLLSRKFQQKLQPKLSKVGGGAQGFAKLIEGFHSKWTARTSCRAGYVVEECKQYRGPKTISTPSPNALLEEIRRSR